MNKQVPFQKGDMDWLERIIDVEVNEVYEWDNMLSHGRAERIIIHIKNLERENALLTGELAFVSENSGKVIAELENRIETLERVCKTEFEDLSDDDYSEWENIAGQQRINELETELERVNHEYEVNMHNLLDTIDDLEERIKTQASSIASYHSDNVMLEAKVVRLEKLLGEIIPLIPNFNFGIKHNPPIANYDYLKYNKEWKK